MTARTANPPINTRPPLAIEFIVITAPLANNSSASEPTSGQCEGAGTK